MRLTCGVRDSRYRLSMSFADLQGAGVIVIYRSFGSCGSLGQTAFSSAQYVAFLDLVWGSAWFDIDYLPRFLQ